MPSPPAWPTAAVPAWHQPLGISFFTFMAMAYLIEVYNRAIPAERNVVHTALFISFFPTVLAGPINRYSRLRLQLAERQVTAPELLSQGCAASSSAWARKCCWPIPWPGPSTRSSPFRPRA